MKGILFATTLFIFVVGCSPEIRYNYDIEIDASNSIDESSFKNYVNIVVDDILPNLRNSDCISIKFIDECSLTKAERIFFIDLSKRDFSKQLDGLNFAVDSASARMKRFIRDTVSIALKELLLKKRTERKNCSNFTNILAALKESASLLNNTKSFSSNLDQLANNAAGKDNFKYENVIIIFSDMINDNAEKTMNFSEFGTLSSKQILKKLDDIKQNDQLPILKNSKVIIYGATSSSNNSRYANLQIGNIKLFWQHYFKDSGAQLIAYGFDTKKEINDFMFQNQQ